MNEALHFDCARARSLLAQFVDGELGAGEATWLGGHLETCAECRAALEAFAALDSELAAWGRELGWRNPPASDARERLAAKMSGLSARSARSRAIRWIPAALAAIAAAVAIAVMAPHAAHPERAGVEQGFVEIPYLAPLDPHERASIVTINIRVATLISMGYKVAADPDTIVPADLLVGEDGRAHAVRVLSDIELTGTGD